LLEELGAGFIDEKTFDRRHGFGFTRYIANGFVRRPGGSVGSEVRHWSDWLDVGRIWMLWRDYFLRNGR
jgi:hypothetical protein